MCWYKRTKPQQKVRPKFTIVSDEEIQKPNVKSDNFSVILFFAAQNQNINLVDLGYEKRIIYFLVKKE